MNNVKNKALSEAEALLGGPYCLIIEKGAEEAFDDIINKSTDSQGNI